MKKYDITGLGELLIDFTPVGLSDAGNKIFERNPGGAPANLLACAAKLGERTAFIGKVGNDSFGDFLADTLINAGVDTKGLCRNPEVNTTLAFVDLDKTGNRSFSFYRKPGADITLEKSDIPDEIISESSIFHFGSLSFTDEPCASATLYAIEMAKEAGAIISYDPNYRPPLWDSENKAKEKMLLGAKYADVMKISDNEILFLTGSDSIENSIDFFLELGISLIMVTCGPEGAFYATSKHRGKRATFDVKTIDTTGAGDAFCGAMLHCLKGKTLEEIRDLSDEELIHITDFGNASGSLSSTKRGGIPSMATEEEILNCIKNTLRL